MTTYECKRCRAAFDAGTVWRVGKRFICKPCSRSYRVDVRANDDSRLERLVGRIQRDLPKLRYAGRCLACDGEELHEPKCPVRQLNILCTRHRGQFAPSIARHQHQKAAV